MAKKNTRQPTGETAALLARALVTKMEIQRLGYPSNFEKSQSLKEALPGVVASNLPGVFRNAAHNLGMPSVADIIDPIRSVQVPIAVTPLGNADSPVGRYFAKPHTVVRSVEWLLKRLEASSQPRDRFYYMQSQDDNLAQLCEQGCRAPRSLSDLGLTPSASNLWIGGEGTTSRLHNDNYDNVYVQVSGSKRIWLIPPGDVYAVHEAFLRPATYSPNMELIPDPPESPSVLFPTLDPSKTTKVDSQLSNVPNWQSDPQWGLQAAITCVDLEPGDVLFLPALWYHQVEIHGADVNISVNYWHEPFCGDVRWAEWDFARRCALIARGDTKDPTYFYDD